MRWLWILCFAAIVISKTSSEPQNGALMTLPADDQDEDDGIVEDEDDQGDMSHVDFSNPNAEPFIPTKEWQDVKPGQSVPSGLNIRLNLQTGKKEARLMVMEESDKIPREQGTTDSSDSSHLQKVKQAVQDAAKGYNMEHSTKSEPLTYWSDGIKQGMANAKKDSYTRDELKQALKKFKTTTSNLDKEKDSIKDKFRTADELLKEMKKLDFSLKMDSEIIKELLDRYKGEDVAVETKQTILTDLEFYVHQIDNAMDFVKMGGLTLAVTELNNTDSTVKSGAALVLGSAVQSNPKVQMEALDAGAMHQLIKMFTANHDDKLLNRVLYAVSGLLRHFPAAQQKFVGLGGIETLTQIITQGSQKMKVKAVTLMNDLIHEKESAILDEQKIQYNDIHLDQNLRDQGWCQLVPELLHSPEHDSRHKIITAMHTLLPSCQSEFMKSLASLRVLQQEYKTEADEESKDNDDDYFFRDLSASVDKLLQELGAFRRSQDL